MVGGEDGRGIKYAVRAFQYGYKFGSICVQSGGTFTHLACSSRSFPSYPFLLTSRPLKYVSEHSEKDAK